MHRQSVRKLSSLQLPKCDFTPKEYKGPSYEELVKIRKNHLNPVLYTYYGKPLAIHQGYKQFLFDIENNRYLDMFGGICTVSVGHAHPKVTQAIAEQTETLGHISNLYLHPKIHEYAERLAEKLPGDLKVLYFVNSGSEANDLATLIAKCYTNKHGVVSLENGYHGMTYQTMALTSTPSFKYPVSHAAGFYKTTNADPYKGAWGGSNCRDGPVQTDRKCSCAPQECAAGNNYVEQLRRTVEYHVGPKNLAAFFAESIQGVGGAVQFPRNYLKQVHQVVKEEGGLFVSDEVQTGFGRTGDHFWGFEAHDIIPDIVTMAKGIGNGFPLGCVATTPEIAQCLTKATHFNTFGGNPLACAAGLAVLDIIEEENLQQNSKEVGTYLLTELAKLREQYPIVGDVRGKGLMIGIELVRDKETRQPLEPSRFLKLWEYIRDQRLILGKGGAGNVIRIKPPMCITMQDADYTLNVLKNAFDLVVK